MYLKNMRCNLIFDSQIHLSEMQDFENKNLFSDIQSFIP